MMKETISCPSKKGKDGKDCIVITIETCSKKTSSDKKLKKKTVDECECDDEVDDEERCDADSYQSNRTVDSSSSDLCNNIEPEARYDPKTKRCRYVLPTLPPRYHGQGCAMEVSVMEKHVDSCVYKKLENACRNSAEDRLGEYDCVGRMTFTTCPAPKSGGRQDEQCSRQCTRPCSQNKRDERPRRDERCRRNDDRQERSRRDDPPPRNERRPCPRDCSRECPRNNEQRRNNDSREETQSERRRPPPRDNNNNGSGGSSRRRDQPTRRPSAHSSREYDSDDRAASRSSGKQSRNNQAVYLALQPRNYPNRAGLVGGPHQSMLHDSSARKHYRGDGCKLQFPTSNRSIFNNTFRALMSSPKSFSVHSDQSNQFPSKELVPKTTKNTNEDELSDLNYSESTIISISEDGVEKLKKDRGAFFNFFKKKSKSRRSGGGGGSSLMSDDVYDVGTQKGGRKVSQ